MERPDYACLYDEIREVIRIRDKIGVVAEYSGERVSLGIDCASIGLARARIGAVITREGLAGLVKALEDLGYTITYKSIRAPTIAGACVSVGSAGVYTVSRPRSAQDDEREHLEYDRLYYELCRVWVPGSKREPIMWVFDADLQGGAWDVEVRAFEPTLTDSKFISLDLDDTWSRVKITNTSYRFSPAGFAAMQRRLVCLGYRVRVCQVEDCNSCIIRARRDPNPDISPDDPIPWDDSADCAKYTKTLRGFVHVESVHELRKTELLLSSVKLVCVNHRHAEIHADHSGERVALRIAPTILDGLLCADMKIVIWRESLAWLVQELETAGYDVDYKADGPGGGDVPCTRTRSVGVYRVVANK